MLCFVCFPAVVNVQVDMKVLSGSFDEGADINEFEHWK
jgi:hypothetical protein